VRVFKTKWFVRFARKERITDRTLWDAVDRADRGLIDADLGGGVIKQRVARSGQGKSSGFRTIVVYRTKTRAIFVFGFAKSGKADLEPDELEGYRELAKVYLAKSESDMDGYVAVGALIKVMKDGEED
jgi:hypothetical protein